MFREGRQFEKIMRSCEKMRLFLNQFFIENPEKIEQKIKKSDICHKHRQKSIPRSTLFRKKSIFNGFGGSRGDPKIAKNLRPLPGKVVLGAIL